MRTTFRYLSLFVFAALFGCAAVGEPAKSEGHPKRASKFDRPGFESFIEDERLWVFKHPSPQWSDFVKIGEPAKSVTWIGSGPDGMTIRGPDADTLLGYIGMTQGFKVIPVKGVVYVFRDPSDELDKYEDFGRMTTRVEMEGGGPNGSTIVSTDQATIDAYRHALGLDQVVEEEEGQ
jgi:hypothetical protein